MQRYILSGTSSVFHLAMGCLLGSCGARIAPAIDYVALGAPSDDHVPCSVEGAADKISSALGNQYTAEQIEARLGVSISPQDWEPVQNPVTYWFLPEKPFGTDNNLDQQHGEDVAKLETAAETDDVLDVSQPRGNSYGATRDGTADGREQAFDEVAIWCLQNGNEK